MRNLRELTTRYSLQEIVEAAFPLEISTTPEIVAGNTAPPVKPEGEKQFVRLHKTAKYPDRAGNKSDVFNATNIKKDDSHPAKPVPGFPPEVKEAKEREPYWRAETGRPEKDLRREKTAKDKARDASARRRKEMSKKHPELAEEPAWTVDELGRFRRVDESGAIGRHRAKTEHPLIKRPKFDERGNVVLTKDAKANIEYGKKPRSRKLTGTPYTGAKRFGESKELDEGKRVQAAIAKATSLKGPSKSQEDVQRNIAKATSQHKEEDDPIHTSGRRSKTRQARAKAGPNFPTVLVSPKGEKGAGKVRRIPKSQYDSKKHSLAEDQLDELSKQKLASYISGRASHLAGAAYSAGAAGATNQPREADAQTKKLHKYQTGIKQASERIGGSYETGKPLRVMIPGKGDNDKASGPYNIKRKKLYHGEETEQLDETGKFVKVAQKIAKVSGKFGKAVGEPFARTIDKVADKLAKVRKETQKEETEQLDELEGNTLGRYAKKAAAAMEKPVSEIKPYRVLQHAKGIGRAVDRLSGSYEHKNKQGKKTTSKYQGSGYSEETELDEGGPTKSHFKMAAETIKAISDEGKRKEHASVHADLYAKQNPRFDRGKFMSACNVKEDVELDEVITKSTPAGDVIHDFVHSDDKRFSGDSKKQRIKRALGAYYGKQRGE